MLSLSDWKVVFVVVGFAGVLLLASPALSTVLHLPGGEKFSELWVLGPSHMAEGYPFNVSVGENYMVYVGVENHMGASAYYGVQLKFRNETEDLPNETVATSSPLPMLYEYRVFLQDGQTWEQPLTFSFARVSVMDNRSVVGGFKVNGVTLDVDKPAGWDSEKNGYFYELFMELWIYNGTPDAFQYHNRFVGLWLNMTVGS
jgi:hypothetical protein